MSVRSQVQAAEEALRQALINALAEGDEEFLSELFSQYQAVSDLNKKVDPSIESNYNFRLSSPYVTKPGGDLDAMDNLIDFNNGTFHVPGAMGDDHISFNGNVEITTGSNDTVTFS